MAKKFCAFKATIKDINGYEVPSKLYDGIQKYLNKKRRGVNNRNLTNLIYTIAKSDWYSSVHGGKKDKNGEFKVQDVIKNLNVDHIIEITVDTVINYEQLHSDLLYKDSLAATNVARNINNKYEGFFAFVEYRPDVEQYQVVIEERTVNNYEHYKFTLEAQENAETLAMVATEVLGLDMVDLYLEYPTLFRAYSPFYSFNKLVQIFNARSTTDSAFLLEKTNEELSIILSYLKAKDPDVFNRLKDVLEQDGLITQDANISDIAAVFWQQLKNGSDIVKNIAIAITEDIFQTREELNNHDFRQNFNKVEVDFKTESINKSIDDLQIAQLSHDTRVFSGRVNSIYELAQKTMLDLKRVDNAFRAPEHISQQDDDYNKKVKATYGGIQENLKLSEYKLATLETLSQFTPILQYFIDCLKDPEQAARRGMYYMMSTEHSFTDNGRSNSYWKEDISDADREFWANWLRVFDQFYNMINTYNNVLINDSITDPEIKNAISELLKLAARAQTIIQEQCIRTNIIASICNKIFGNSTNENNNYGTTEVAASQTVESMPFLLSLYGIGHSKNKYLTILGKYIMQAREEKVRKLNEYTNRIAQADAELRRAGESSEFMFDEDGVHIISVYDWDAAIKALEDYNEQLKKRGYTRQKRLIELKKYKKKIFITEGGAEVPNKQYRKSLNLTAAQQKYYDTIMQIKKELDDLIPEYCTNLWMAPHVRRSFVDGVIHSFKGGIHIGELGRVIWLQVKKIWQVPEDDFENYNRNTVVFNSTLDGRTQRTIPIYTIKELEDPREQLMDFSACMQKLAATAINFNVLSGIEQQILLVEDLLEEQSTGSSKEMFTSVGYSTVRQPLKAAKGTESTVLKYYRAYKDMHIYGRHRASTGFWDQIIRSLVKWTSITSLAVNIKGAVANVGVGVLQELIESAGGEYYNMADLLWALQELTTSGIANTPAALMDWYSNNTTSKIALLKRTFDPQDDIFSDLSDKRFHRNVVRKLAASDPTFILYSTGETFLHLLNMYSYLHSVKVYDSNQDKYISLYDALEVVQDPNNPSQKILRVKDGIQQFATEDLYKEKMKGYMEKLKNSGVSNINRKELQKALSTLLEKPELRDKLMQNILNENDAWYYLNIEDPSIYKLLQAFRTYIIQTGNNDVTNTYLSTISTRLRYINHSTQGNMSQEGLGTLHRYAMGAAVMNLRQWMIGHFSRRFRGEHFDVEADKKVEGYYVTLLKSLYHGVKTLARLEDTSVYWETFDSHKKANLRRAIGEIAALIGLHLLCIGAGDYNDPKNKRSYWRKFMLYQLWRLRQETEQSTIFIPFLTSKTFPISVLEGSAVPFLPKLKGLLYVTTGAFIRDLNDREGVKVGIGKYKNRKENKALHNFKRYCIPCYWSLYQQLTFDSSEAWFLTLDNARNYWRN